MIQGINDFGFAGYRGPAPEKGQKYYYFRMFVLNNFLNISLDSNGTTLKKNINQLF